MKTPQDREAWQHHVYLVLDNHELSWYSDDSDVGARLRRTGFAYLFKTSKLVEESDL